MLLGTFYEGVEIHREEKMVFARFLKPHRVISTCSAAGGLRDDLTCVYNHQSCEPVGHERPLHGLISRKPQAYREVISCRHGLPPEGCATLGTAANMRHATIKRASFREVEVVAVCTGGVETNAGRAGAMVRAVITATEGKTAALQELAVGSRYSDGLATGTGTDQIGIAARLGTGIPLTSSGKHSVLGELIGKTVHAAVCETLMLQNQLTPEGQRSVVIHLERFGTTGPALLEATAAHLEEAEAVLLRNNFSVIQRDPLVVAAVAALVHVRDKVAWGILPQGCVPELWATYGAQVAAAVSGDYTHLEAYRQTLAALGSGLSNQDLVRLTAAALALGFHEKWPEPVIEEVSHGD